MLWSGNRAAGGHSPFEAGRWGRIHLSVDVVRPTEKLLPGAVLPGPEPAGIVLPETADGGPLEGAGSAAKFNRGRRFSRRPTFTPREKTPASPARIHLQLENRWCWPPVSQRSHPWACPRRALPQSRRTLARSARRWSQPIRSCHCGASSGASGGRFRLAGKDQHSGDNRQPLPWKRTYITMPIQRSR